MRTLEEYAELLKPKKHDLDNELENQSQLFWEVSNACAQAHHTYNRAYAQRKVEQGRAAERQRDRLISEKGKATEGQVAAAVDSDPDLVHAKKIELDAQLEYEQWSAMRDAYNQRSYALKDLAALFVSNYYQTDFAAERTTRQSPEELRGRRRAAKED